jgi:hypothetical protein
MFSLRKVFFAKKNKKNNLDSSSRWGIFADNEVWSRGQFSQNLDLGAFVFTM